MYVLEWAIAILINVLVIAAIALIGLVVCLFAILDYAQSSAREVARDFIQKLWKSLPSKRF